MFVTVSVLFGGGLTLAKLRPSSNASSAEQNKPVPSANPTARPAVNVFNGTSTAGLARQVSGVLATRGWQIQQVGNWSGKALQKTTIYYPTGYEQAASALAQETTAVIAPAPTKLSQTTLTLVLMK